MVAYRWGKVGRGRGVGGPGAARTRKDRTAGEETGCDEEERVERLQT